jgi:DNA polymerase family B
MRTYECDEHVLGLLSTQEELADLATDEDLESDPMRTKARRWIGVDGEGVGRKPHRYVLLACSDGDYVENRRGLSTGECLDFLLDLGSRDVRVCGYYLSYDWTMILRDLPDAALYTLFRPELRQRQVGGFERIEYEGYKIHWLAGAMWLRDDHRKVTIWDIGKYYQAPFVTALKLWKVRPDVQDKIAEMKKRRSLFTWREISSIRKYCLNECEALAELATALEAAHIDADLKPRGWFGPGSTASVLLNRHEIQERRGILPPVMLEPVACAFFGGRAEISTNGYVRGPIHGYDISSAYPHHASQLPCLEHGRWERVTRERALTGKGVVHALVHGHLHDARGDWAPLPVRLANGTIVFPRSGARGFWWRDEWLAAREGWKGLQFDHAYVLRRECNCKPFAFIPELFAHRRKLGKETGAGITLKLALNSLYGKLAQTIGKAQYASRVWAGMITSGTRAQVLRLMQRHKKLDSVLMIATDGLFSTEELEVDKEIVLGGWEHAQHDSITLVRPGIYWLGGAEILAFPQPMIQVRQVSGRTLLVPPKELGGTKLRARGLGRDNLDTAKVELALALQRGDDRVVLAPRTTFGGAKLTVYGPNLENLQRSDHYGQWHTMPTHVSLAPGPKRTHDWSPPRLIDVESAPYGTRQTQKQGELFEILELLRDFMN